MKLSQRIKELEHNIKIYNRRIESIDIGNEEQFNKKTYELVKAKAESKIEGLKQGAELQRTEMLEKIKELRLEWRDKCKRMEIMSGEVAIFELSVLLDKLIKELEKSE